MIGVITADIIDSTKIGVENRDELVSVLKKIEQSLQAVSSVRIELYRGDSFQALIPDAEKGVQCALIIRSGLMAFAAGSAKWDARISLGVGGVSYQNERITMSDGEAFRLSGRAFDAIGKKRLVISTPSEMLNSEFELTSAFADDIVCGWSKKQAELIHRVLVSNTPRKELALIYGTSVQNVGKTLRVAKEDLIRMYLERVERQIRNLQ